MPASCASFAGDGRGWTFGESGALYTRAIRLTWIRRRVEEPTSLGGSSRLAGVAVGANATIRKRRWWREWRTGAVGQNACALLSLFCRCTAGWAVARGDASCTARRANWRRKSLCRGSLFDVKFSDDQDGWSAGATELLHTRDGGTWLAIDGTTHPLESLHFSNGRGWAAARRTTFLNADAPVKPELKVGNRDLKSVRRKAPFLGLC